MNTGTYTRQGATHHLMCQDYALHGPNYAILSDGCSTAPNTDFGARLLAKSAELQLLEHNQLDARAICERARSVKDVLHLHDECLRATLLTARTYGVDDETWVECTSFGDGVIVAKHRDGHFEWIEIKYESGAPYYPIYSNEAGSREQYEKKFGSKGIVTLFKGNWQEYHSCPYDLPIDLPAVQCFQAKDFEFVAIMTDGVSSFFEMKNQGTSKCMSPVPLIEILKLLMDFKGFDNQFVVNQCHWLFEKDAKDTFKRLGWKNGDDFSIGVIHCG